MTLETADVAVSAPGKVLLAGGYLVLDRAHKGLVLGLSARINVVATAIHTGPGVHLSEVVVESAQFREAQWRYGYHMADDGGGIKVTQLQAGAAINPNPFVETTLGYALSYVAHKAGLTPRDSISPTRLVILADNDYYSLPDDSRDDSKDGNNKKKESEGGRFARFPTTIGQTNKTGLGSSAALVTALSAAVLAHYLPATAFDLGSERGRRTLHNLAQAAHCAAQGKVGSGFDVAAAVYGGCTYTRFSPSVLTGLPAVGAKGFGGLLARLVDEAEEEGGKEKKNAKWDADIVPGGVELPTGVTLRMCDVDCGSQTVGMVKKVLAWREAEPTEASTLWGSLQARNDELATTLREGRLDDLAGAVVRVRELVRAMGGASEVPIEPPSQTRLLNALSEVDGVYGGVAPGAGGYDALALLMRDDEPTERRVREFLEQWRWDDAEAGLGKVRLLGVRGEMQGARTEDLAQYQAWI